MPFCASGTCRAAQDVTARLLQSTGTPVQKVSASEYLLPRTGGKPSPNDRGPKEGPRKRLHLVLVACSHSLPYGTAGVQQLKAWGSLDASSLGEGGRGQRAARQDASRRTPLPGKPSSIHARNISSWCRRLHSFSARIVLLQSLRRGSHGPPELGTRRPPHLGLATEAISE